MRNAGLRLAAVLLAALVWFMVSAPRRERVRERIVTASISLVAMPSNLVITTDIPSTVAVRVRGRSSYVRAVTAQSLEAAVDLSGIPQSGEVEVTLRAQHLTVPEEIEVVSIVPNKIRFRVEELRQRAVPIRPFLAGEPPGGYIIGDVTAQPALALVSGPESQILKLSEVATERIIMTGRTATFAQNAAVVSDSPLVRVISPLTTQVTVPVIPEMGPSPQAVPEAPALTGTEGKTTTE